ncbi:hypothetical protein SLA2020_057930 [Shorea laevis]
MASPREVAVFTDTNLGTHLAMAASPDITAGDFKRELGRVHLSCFPELGEIRVLGLMVKQKSYFYHLPESIPIRHAFQGHKGTWFLYAEASTVNGSTSVGLSEALPLELQKTEPLPKMMKAVKLKCQKHENEKGCFGRNDEVPGVTANEGFIFLASKNEVESTAKQNSCSMVESSNDSLSGNSIYRRYFSNCSEVTKVNGNASSLGADVSTMAVQTQPEEQHRTKRDGCCSSMQIDSCPDFLVRTPPRKLFCPLSVDRSAATSSKHLPRNIVGKGLLTASNNIRISENRQLPAISFSRFRDGKIFRNDTSFLAKYSVFDFEMRNDNY